MNRPAFILATLALAALSIYLFVSAPAPLPTEVAAGGELIPIEVVLATVAAENDVVRALWTQEIVGAGKQAGLAFSEEWEERGVDAGPLPALFLRESAAALEKAPTPLSLFLGSDFPINPSNHFEGLQVAAFEQIRLTEQPQFFLAEDLGLYTAMFPDLASVEPCVVCHNEHEASPKSDWKLGDVMGATTWAYPEAAVTTEQYLEIISALRASFRAAYDSYLQKSETFAAPPQVGDRWPRDGYYLPSADVFMAEFTRKASAATLADLLQR